MKRSAGALCDCSQRKHRYPPRLQVRLEALASDEEQNAGGLGRRTPRRDQPEQSDSGAEQSDSGAEQRTVLCFPYSSAVLGEVGTADAGLVVM